MSVENPLENRGEQTKPEYQSVENIVLKKVSDGEVGFDNAIEITLPSDGELSVEEIEKRVREELKNRNWWLQEYWQEKGLPKEQVNIQVGENKITLYNFGEQLQERHLQELQKVLADFSKVDDSKPLETLKYILIDDKKPLNPNTGIEMRGYGAGSESAVKVYPKGTEFSDYRTEETPNFQGVSDFEATVIHELTHNINETVKTNLRNEWLDKFNFKYIRENKVLAGGAITAYETSQPERCVSTYAQVNPEEDICESMVAVLRKPDVLDPEKLQLLQDRLLKDSEPLPVDMQRSGDNEVELPKIDSEVNYKTKKSSIKFRRVVREKPME